LLFWKINLAANLNGHMIQGMGLDSSNSAIEAGYMSTLFCTVLSYVGEGIATG
jgi:hypothetical protein